MLNIGDEVFLSATQDSVCGIRGRIGPESRKGPFKITEIYLCGSQTRRFNGHTRIKAYSTDPDRYWEYVDAAVHAFEPA